MRKTMLGLVTAMLVGVLTLPVAAECYEDLVVSGAGWSSLNGTYSYYATGRWGRPLYLMGSARVMLYYDRTLKAFCWMIGCYYNTQDTPTPPADGWEVRNPSYAPPPTVSGGGPCDATPPEIVGCPKDLTWYAAPGETTALVFWDPPTAIDDVDPDPVLSATAEPGDAFPLGSRLVVHTATDAAGNASSCEFVVTVLEQVAPTGIVETATAAFDGIPYQPGEVAALLNIASQAIADGAPSGTTLSLLKELIQEDTPVAEFIELLEQYAALIEAGTPPGQAKNEVLGTGNAN